MNIQRY